MKAEDLMILGAAALVAVGLVWYVKKGAGSTAAGLGVGVNGGSLFSWQDPGTYNILTNSYEPYSAVPSGWVRPADRD